MLHQLSARAVIRDWDDGMLHSDRLEHEVRLFNSIVDLLVIDYKSFIIQS